MCVTISLIKLLALIVGHLIGLILSVVFYSISWVSILVFFFSLVVLYLLLLVVVSLLLRRFINKDVTYVLVKE